ncbi:hypothetical protein [Magnetospirillum fulvum]|jgi:hypothetical protein|uniref:Uncharacterized protein n=1 Tax=Magnetospirillum fulvum TaxID=1082 RepID=A0A1H6GVP4_MAGFU|nr:hypothetical protein [Magnetospirillum fulvum]SEH25895.1 hypothetical protein SAMN04244559_00334 [Magnetospirillum fulvum]
MAKGQKRTGREPKKPKTAVKAVAPPPSLFDASRLPAKKGFEKTPKASRA